MPYYRDQLFKMQLGPTDNENGDIRGMPIVHAWVSDSLNANVNPNTFAYPRNKASVRHIKFNVKNY